MFIFQGCTEPIFIYKGIIRGNLIKIPDASIDTHMNMTYVRHLSNFIADICQICRLSSDRWQATNISHIDMGVNGSVWMSGFELWTGNVKSKSKILDFCHNPTQLNPKLGRPYFPKKPPPHHRTEPSVTFSQLLHNLTRPNSVCNLISTQLEDSCKKIGSPPPNPNFQNLILNQF